MSHSQRRLQVDPETWPIAGSFTISRGSKSVAEVVVARVTEGATTGRGECVPYARHGETVGEVVRQIGSIAAKIEDGCTAMELQALLPPGAARNALDCALVDLEAKLSGVPARIQFALPEAQPAITALTISLGTADAMAAAAARVKDRPLLKLKLGGAGDEARIAAVRSAAPYSTLIVDANEAWNEALLTPLTAACWAAGVKLIEQPLPERRDDVLSGFVSPVPICADESCRDRSSLAALKGKYNFINVKLDKAGGITEAVALTREAKRQGFGIMLGCMVGTSLAMAPIAMLAPFADFIDLDGPLLLEKDRANGIAYDGTLMHQAAAALWG